MTEQALAASVRPVPEYKRAKLAKAAALALELNTPITTYLQQIGVKHDQWLALKSEKAFLTEVNDARKELTSGNRLLREAMSELLPLAVQRVGDMLRDPEIHPQWHMKAAETVFRESGQSQATQPVGGSDGPRFTLTINIGGTDGEPPQTMVVNAGGQPEEETEDADVIEGEATTVPNINIPSSPDAND